MVEMTKGVVRDVMKEWDQTYIKTGQPLEIISELFRIQIKNILCIAFGEDIGHLELDHIEDGVVTKKPFTYVIKHTST
jgi:hypothetical protein